MRKLLFASILSLTWFVCLPSVASQCVTSTCSFHVEITSEDTNYNPSNVCFSDAEQNIYNIGQGSQTFSGTGQYDEGPILIQNLSVDCNQSMQSLKIMSVAGKCAKKGNGFKVRRDATTISLVINPPSLNATQHQRTT